MTNEKIYFESIYLEALLMEETPVIILHNGLAYDLSRKAVRDLKFDDQGLSFKASFKGKVQTIKVPYDEISEIGAQE